MEDNIMPRPKGSKNKKNVAPVDPTKQALEEKKAALYTAEAKEKEIQANIADLKKQLAAARKEKRAAAKAVDVWAKKIEEQAAIQAAAAHKAQIEELVAKLIEEGKTPDEILGLLNN